MREVGLPFAAIMLAGFGVFAVKLTVVGIRAAIRAHYAIERRLERYNARAARRFSGEQTP